MSGLKIAIVSTCDIDKPPVRALMLKGWLERESSPLRGRTHIRIFEPGNPAGLTAAAAQISLFRPDVLFFYTHFSWPEKDLFAAFLPLKKENPELVAAVYNDSVVNLSREKAGAHGIDFVLRGESELNFEKIIMRRLSAGWKHPETTEIMQDYGEMENLNEIPSPFLNHKINLSGTEKMQIFLGRGCPNSCFYCPIGESSMRYFAPERILSEIRAVLEQAPNMRRILLMAPDMFSPETAGLIPHIRKMAEERNVIFDFYTHSGFRHEDTAIASADSPFFHIRAGVQSFNAASLAAVNRLSDPAAARENLLRIRRFAPSAELGAELILGLPYETVGSWLEMLEWMARMKIDIFVNHLFVPPESLLALSPEGKKYKVSEEMPYFAVSTNTLSAAELSKLSSRTKKIFMVLNLLKTSHALSHVFYSLSASFQGICPHISLAEKTAAELLNNKKTASRAQEYLNRMQPYSLSTKDYSFFSADFIRDAAAVFRRIFMEQ